MDCKKKVCIYLCFLFFAFFLHAQQKDLPSSSVQDIKDYFITESDEGAVLYQRLSWEAVEDILAYEFELEHKVQEGIWEQLEKKTVEDNFIDVSLPPGSYRFRVAVVNLLGQTESLSDFRSFDILFAYQPEVHSLSRQLIYFDNIFDNRLIVLGRNFFSTTEFSLEKPLADPLVLIPVEISDDGTRAVFELDASRIPPGDYLFCVRDRSGLYDKSQPLILKFQKPVDTYVSVGYALTGFTEPSIFKEYYHRDISPLGGLFRCTLIPIKKNYGYFGFNFSVSSVSLDKKVQAYKLSGTLLLPQIHIAYIYPIIKHRFNADFHFGTGTVFLVNSRFLFSESDLTSPSFWYWGISINAGAAMQFYVYKKLYLEFNSDHIWVMRKGFPKYMYQPQLSIGWEF